MSVGHAMAQGLFERRFALNHLKPPLLDRHAAQVDMIECVRADLEPRLECPEVGRAHHRKAFDMARRAVQGARHAVTCEQGSEADGRRPTTW